MSPFKVESLLSARLFLSLQLVGNRLYFVHISASPAA